MKLQSCPALSGHGPLTKAVYLLPALPQSNKALGVPPEYDLGRLVALRTRPIDRALHNACAQTFWEPV